MAEMYKALQELCRRKGVTITEMCRQAGVPRSSVGNLAAGSTRQLSAKNLQKLAAYFGVPADVLLGSEATGRPAESAPDILDEIDIAFYGEYRELTEEDKAVLRDMVHIMRQRRAKRQGG